MTPAVEITAADAERLRQILGAYDAKHRDGNKEFDLANPPVPPYRHKEHPLAMYNHETGESLIAKDAAEEKRLAKEGFIRDCLPPAQESAIRPEMTAEEAAQVAEIEAKAKRGPGRPPKSQAA